MQCEADRELDVQRLTAQLMEKLDGNMGYSFLWWFH